MQMTVFMNEAGVVLLANSQGAILTECFFKAEDETQAGLRHMGYRHLIQTYPGDDIVAGTGIEPEDLGELFLES